MTWADPSIALKAIDNVDKLLAQGGYAPDSSARHQLAIARSIVNAGVQGISPAESYIEVGAVELGEQDGANHRERFAVLNARADNARAGTKLYAKVPSGVPVTPGKTDAPQDADGAA